MFAPNIPNTCYHCGLPVPGGSHYAVVIEGASQLMCCPGCQAVAMTIVDGGLENFYRYRSSLSERPESDLTKSKTDWNIYDLEKVQSEFVTEYGDEHNSELNKDLTYKQANLLLEGISCAACGWLIETHCKKNPAIKNVIVNMTTHRCTLIWSPSLSPLSLLLASFEKIGYRSRPATDDQQQQLIKKENRTALMRLGVAGFGMMQAMMVAVGIYTGATEMWLDVLRWLSMLAATPVVFFSSAPFFKAAWHSIRSRQLIMDVPVALAIGLAYAASVWATILGTGEGAGASEVYFESVSMFAFFLLLGRHIEQRARHRNRLAFGNLAQLMPLTACCVTQQNGGETLNNISLRELAVNDLVLVKAGDTFPCDGLVVEGESDVVEAIVTGESIPLHKKIGDRVIAGTLNGQSALRVKVTAVGGATQLSGIERLATQAALEKPKQVVMADKIARFFVARLLVVCLGVFLFWWFKDSSRAFWITLSVLVVTCPCALALAMPAALSAATGNLRQRGFLVARGHVIEVLSNITRIIFDKTGTLTEGKFCISEVLVAEGFSRDTVLAIAAALERDSSHPIAIAFKPFTTELVVSDAKQFVALGVEGKVDNEIYRLGALAFCNDIIRDNALNSPLSSSAPDEHKLWLLLCNSKSAVAWFGLEDAVRPSAQKAIAELQSMGIVIQVLSGDKYKRVENIALSLGITQFAGELTPSDKLAQLSLVQMTGEKVMMVGDGINDVPVLAGADISVAIASSSDLTQTRADAVLLSNQLTVLPDAIRLAARTRRIIKQNLFFSLTYNLLALPLAAMGHVPPWAAAIGMTMSSLIVVINALRLSR
jgi:P-type Cu2+ transporter